MPCVQCLAGAANTGNGSRDLVSDLSMPHFTLGYNWHTVPHTVHCTGNNLADSLPERVIGIKYLRFENGYQYLYFALS